MPMKLFWILAITTLSVVAAIMGYIAWLARQVPDKSEKEVKLRLNPDQLRMLAYAVMVLLLLLATMYELNVMYPAEAETSPSNITAGS